MNETRHPLGVMQQAPLYINVTLRRNKDAESYEVLQIRWQSHRLDAVTAGRCAHHFHHPAAVTPLAGAIPPGGGRFLEELVLRCSKKKKKQKEEMWTTKWW